MKDLGKGLFVPRALDGFVFGALLGEGFGAGYLSGMNAKKRHVLGANVFADQQRRGSCVSQSVGGCGGRKRRRGRRVVVSRAVCVLCVFGGGFGRFGGFGGGCGRWRRKGSRSGWGRGICDVFVRRRVFGGMLGRKRRGRGSCRSV